MKIYQNPYLKRVRNSHILEIKCGHCGQFIAHYRKEGRGGLVQIYHERIIESTLNLSHAHSALYCPNCNERLATAYTTRMTQRLAYRLMPSAVHHREVQL